MKRIDNIHFKICDLNNILSCCKEIGEKSRNLNRISILKSYTSSYISKIENIVENQKYIVGPYNHFVLYEPQKRNIVNQGILDKIVNHLVARYILYPAILFCLLAIEYRYMLFIPFACNTL